MLLRETEAGECSRDAAPEWEEIKRVIREYRNWSDELSRDIADLKKEYREMDELSYAYAAYRPRNLVAEVRRTGYEDPGLGWVKRKEDELSVSRRELAGSIRELEARRNRIRRIHMGFVLLPREEQQVLKGLYLEQKSWKALPQEMGISKRTMIRLRDQGFERIRQYFMERGNQ